MDESNESDDLQLREGLVVRACPEYLLIWSPHHDLVRAPELGLAYKWPLGSWIQYRAFSENSAGSQNSASNCRYTAYEICRSRQDCNHLEAKVILAERREDAQVELITFVTRPVRHLDVNRMLAEDPFLGPILCNPDPRLLAELNSSGEEVQVQIKVMFTEAFPDIARFMATSMKDERTNAWIKLPQIPMPQTTEQPQTTLNNQPRSFGTLRNSSTSEVEFQNKTRTFGSFVNKVIPHEHSESEPEEQPNYPRPRSTQNGFPPHNFYQNGFKSVNGPDQGLENIKLPDGWKGDRRISTNEYIDVLGICIGHEDCVENSSDFTGIPVFHSLVATRHGLARQPTNLPLGIWIRAAIVKKEDGEFMVLRSEKIFPPMSTRIVPMDGPWKSQWGQKGVQQSGSDAELIILYSNIIVNEGPANSMEQFYINPFLGKVIDPAKNVPTNLRHGYPGAVELGVKCVWNKKLGRKDYEWIVLRFHGFFSPTTKIVSLLSSVCPLNIGRRCDDVHTILIDQYYASSDPNLLQMRSSSDPIQTSHFAPMPSSSSYSSIPTVGFVTHDDDDEEGNLAMPGSSNTLTGKIIDIESSEDEKDDQEGMSKCLKREHKILAELPIYLKSGAKNEGMKEKRYIGIVVEKMLYYAVLYTKKFGLVIAIAGHFDNLQQFDSLCVLGQWICTTIVPVQQSTTQDKLSFTHVCLPKFEPKTQTDVYTRVNADGQLEILLNCDFSISKLKQIDVAYFSLSTELGDVLVGDWFIQQNELVENVVDVWVHYTGNQPDIGDQFVWKIDDDASIVTSEEKAQIACGDGLNGLAPVFQSTSLEATNSTAQKEDGEDGLIVNIEDEESPISGTTSESDHDKQLELADVFCNHSLVENAPPAPTPSCSHSHFPATSVLRDFSVHNYAKKLFGN